MRSWVIQWERESSRRRPQYRKRQGGISHLWPIPNEQPRHQSNLLHMEAGPPGEAKHKILPENAMFRDG